MADEILCCDQTGLMLADGVEPSRANSVVGQVEAPQLTPMTAASALVGRSHLLTTGLIMNQRQSGL